MIKAKIYKFNGCWSLDVMDDTENTWYYSNEYYSWDDAFFQGFHTVYNLRQRITAGLEP